MVYIAYHILYQNVVSQIYLSLLIALNVFMKFGYLSVSSQNQT